MEEISVGPDGIRLGQLLKLANVVESGGEVRPLLTAGRVTVNGVVETRRGARLRSGDVVAVGDARITIRLSLRSLADETIHRSSERCSAATRPKTHPITRLLSATGSPAGSRTGCRRIRPRTKHASSV